MMRHLCILLIALAALLPQAQAQPLPPLDAGIAQVSAGMWHTCAVTTAGAAWCWGENDEGQLGDGSTTPSDVPVAVSGLPTGTALAAIAPGNGHTCALTTTGDVYCWGYDSAGQLGDGGGISSPTPLRVDGLGGPASAIAVGTNRSCAIVGGALYCWGQNWQGQLGDGTTNSSGTPVHISALSNVTAVALGQAHSCAIAGGTVYCWGSNGDGRVGVGDGVTARFTTPQPLTGLTGATALGAGSAHTCALMGDGGVQCWGDGAKGQLGNGVQASQSAPVAVSGLAGASALAVGSQHACALVGGALRCWGNDDSGQLGNGEHGSSAARSTPVVTVGLTGVSAISAGDNHICALTGSGPVRCWGDGYSGQLGDGFTQADTASDTLRDTPPWLPQTIAFAAPGAQAVGTPLPLAASASSGLPVAYSASGACSLSGHTLSFNTAGTCTVTASQAGSTAGMRPDWLPAASVQRSFDVTGTGAQPQPVAVPTLSQWGLALLMLVLSSFGLQPLLDKRKQLSK